MAWHGQGPPQLGRVDTKEMIGSGRHAHLTSVWQCPSKAWCKDVLQAGRDRNATPGKSGVREARQ